MEIETVGVVGAGQMGNGIAHVMAQAGYEVLLTDISQEALDAGVAKIRANMERQVGRGKLEESVMEARLGESAPRWRSRILANRPRGRIRHRAGDREAGDFRGSGAASAAHTILTSNTSSISITRLASRTDRPEKFMGFHFMNPVPIMQLVELIRGIATDKPTYDACLGVVEKLGKTAASSEDFPAFIVNRILMPMINEAVYTLYEGVGNVTSIDTSMKLGTNHPMGPLELADFIGLDTCLAIMNVLHDGLADTKYRPCPLLTKYVEAGWLGRKTGAAFTTIAATRRCRRAERGRCLHFILGGAAPSARAAPHPRRYFHQENEAFFFGWKYRVCSAPAYCRETAYARAATP
jgi:3-hydroxybutyryl-CoA dehydrogenase